MKLFFSILLVTVTAFTAHSQDLMSKINKDAGLLLSVNGASLFENISLAEVENSLLFKELSYELFRSKAMAKPTQFSDIGVNVQDQFYFAIENAEDMTYYIFTYKISEISKFEAFVKTGDATDDNFKIENGLNILSYSAESKLVWNNEYALFITSMYVGEEYSYSYYDSYYGNDYSDSYYYDSYSDDAVTEVAVEEAVYEVVEMKCEEGKCEAGEGVVEEVDYAQQEKERQEKYKKERERKEKERKLKEEKREKEREEKRLKKEQFIESHMMERVSVFFSDNTDDKIEITGFEEDAVLSLWYRNINFMNLNPYRYGYYGVFGSSAYFGLGHYFSGDYYGNLFFDEKQINLESKIMYSDKLKESFKNIYSTKLNNKFIKYLSGDVLGYTSISFSTEDLISETEKVSQDFFENSEERYSAEISTYIDLMSVIIDEEAVGDLVTGDALFILNDFAYKTVEYTAYEYDENFNSTRVKKTKEELLPEFTVMVGSKNERIIAKLFKLAVKRNLLSTKNSYFIIRDKYNDFPFEMYLAYKDDILFLTNSTNQVANVIAGKAEVKLSSKHKKMIKKNSSASYLNMNLLAEKVLMDADMNRDLRMLFEIKDDLREFYATSKFKKGALESSMVMPIPEGEKGSAIYLLNMIDKMIAHETNR